jgi:hypothetical protein
MLRVKAIHASPKRQGSVSARLLEQLSVELGISLEPVQAVRMNHQVDASLQLADLLQTDILVIACPLYVDALPAPLVKLLVQLEAVAKTLTGPLPTLYALCNCGFYEAAQTAPALAMLRHFAQRAGLAWGYGIGIGGGGLLRTLPRAGAGGPAAPIFAALHEMSKAMRATPAEPHDDVLVSPQFPRSIYRLLANLGFRRAARQHGAVARLNDRPHL